MGKELDMVMGVERTASVSGAVMEEVGTQTTLKRHTDSGKSSVCSDLCVSAVCKYLELSVVTAD